MQHGLLAAEPKTTGAKRFSQQLQKRYADRRREMLFMVDAMIYADQFTDAEFLELGAVLHKFAGSAAMFGDRSLGTVALELGEKLVVWTRQERSENMPAAVAALQNIA